MTSEPETSSRGRPRDSALDQRVLDATLSLLRERGWPGVRVDDIARTCAVPKSSIYRRWPSVQHLVVDAMVDALGQDWFEPTDDAASDLRALVTRIADRLAGGDGVALLQVGVALMNDPELSKTYRARLVDPNRELAVGLVERGQAEGAFRADVDARLAVDQSIGGLVYRRLVLHEPVTDSDLESMVAELLRRLECSGTMPAAE